MALLPLLLDELLEEYRRPSLGDLYDQNFGLGLFGRELDIPSRTLLAVPLTSGYLRPWRISAPAESGVSNVQNTKEEFKVSLDVQQFKPEELKVSVVDDYLVVEAKHEEKRDEHGYIAREFRRRYKLPKDTDAKAFTSTLSSDGVLTLHAPKKAIEGSSAKEIPIVQTHAPAVKNKEGAKKQGQAEKMDTK